VIEEASIVATFRGGQPARLKLALPVGADAPTTEGGLSTSFTDIAILSDSSAALSVSGDIRFDPEFVFELDIALSRLERFRLAANGDLVASLDLALVAQSAFSLEADKTIARVPEEPHRIVIPAAIPIAVAIEAEFGAGATCHSDAPGSASTGVTVTSPVVLGAEYVDGAWQALWSGETGTWEARGPVDTLPGEAGVRGYLRGRVNVMLYDSVGPHFGFRPYVELSTSVDAGKKQLAWSLGAGLDAFSGVEAGLLGRALASQAWDFSLAEEDLRMGTRALQTFLISGAVRELDAVVADVTLTLGGDETGVATAGADGLYSFDGLLSGAYTVTPSKEGYGFSPEQLVVTVSGVDATGRNFAVASAPPGDDAVGDSVVVALPGGSAYMTFVYVPPGTFTMGSPPQETDRWEDEGPQHEVTISKGFYLGKCEVTKGQWEAVMHSNPSFHYEHSAACPVEYVSWDHTQEFIEKLNQAVGSEVYRLPTEAEWEYACRAGSANRWSYGNNEGDLVDYAWYRGNYSSDGTKEVGTKKPNPWGLYDMHGNVQEWCQDWYGPYSHEPQTDPTGALSGSWRVCRGGYYGSYLWAMSSAKRWSLSPDDYRPTVGFRVLRQVQ